jgi:tight adherence protein B
MRKVRGLTAMGRMSAYVLVALPFALALLLTAINPDYMKPLYETGTGHMLIGIALGMMAVGALILRKMVDIRG